MATSCFYCNSHDTKRATAVAEQLHINTNATIIGGGFFGGSGGIAAARSSGNSSPELVKRINEKVPHRAGFFNVIKWIIISFMFLIFAGLNLDNGVISGTGKFFMWCLGISVLAVIVKVVGMFTYPKRRRYYDSLWYCFSCGKFMTVN